MQVLWEAAEIGLLRDDGREDVGNRFALKRMFAGEDLVKNYTEAQMSARLSTGLPRACSGACMHRCRGAPCAGRILSDGG